MTFIPHHYDTERGTVSVTLPIDIGTDTIPVTFTANADWVQVLVDEVVRDAEFDIIVTPTAYAYDAVHNVISTLNGGWLNYSATNISLNRGGFDTPTAAIVVAAEADGTWSVG